MTPENGVFILIHRWGGDFEGINILEAQAVLGFSADDLSNINFPNKIQYNDEESFKRENHSMELKEKASFQIKGRAESNF